MNTKLSGAQLVLVPIQRVGRNYFPYVENLNGRVIKYIDFVETMYLPDTDVLGVGDSSQYMITIMNEYGNEALHRDLPLARLSYNIGNGIRQPIFKKVSLKTTFVDCQKSSDIGKMAAFVFWYDLPEFSARNTTKELVTDSISVPLTTAVRYNQLPDIERMTGKRFRRILGFCPTTTPDLQTGVSFSEYANMFLTLRKGSYNVLENVPLYMFYQLLQLEKMEFQNIIFDLQSSYITIGGAGTIPNVQTDYIGKSVFFNVQYEAK